MLKVWNRYDFIFLWTRIKRKERGFVCFGFFSPWTCVLAKLLQSCLTLSDPVDWSVSGSSVHGILQARRLEWVAISFLREIFPTQGSNPCLLHCRRILCLLSHQGSPKYCLGRLMGKGGVGGGTGCLCWGPGYRPRGWVLLSLWVSLWSVPWWTRRVIIIHEQHQPKKERTETSSSGLGEAFSWDIREYRSLSTKNGPAGSLHNLPGWRHSTKLGFQLLSSWRPHIICV